MANRDHVERLSSSVEDWNRWRADGGLPELRRASLSRADLRGADLDEADLRGADLSGARLAGASLRKANLGGADLRGADLRGADLRGADLRGADLRDTDLSEANLAGALFDEPAPSEATDAGSAKPTSAGEDEGNRAMLAERRDQAMLSEVRPRRPLVDDPGLGARLAERILRPVGPTRGRQGEEIRFTTFHPARARVGAQHELLAYVHLTGASRAVLADHLGRLGERAGGYRQTQTDASRPLPRGAVVTVVPECESCWFWPPRRRLRWTRDWHRADFRMSVRSRAGPLPSNPIQGRVSFYVGPILLGETVFTLSVDRPSPDAVEESAPLPAVSASPYRSIFVSYSRRDKFVVGRVREAATLLGDRVLRDVDVLRSGQDWNAALLQLIDRADVFQLYWSTAAKRSPFVEREWRHAIGRAGAKPSFVRPLYWQKRMPEPPQELAGLHFAFLDLGPWGRFRAWASRRFGR